MWYDLYTERFKKFKFNNFFQNIEMIPKDGENLLICTPPNFKNRFLIISKIIIQFLLKNLLLLKKIVLVFSKKINLQIIFMYYKPEDFSKKIQS